MKRDDNEDVLLRSVALQNAQSILLARQRAEEELRKQSEWLRVTLASIGDAVISTDAEGRVNFMNGPAESLTGWAQSEALGHPLGEVFCIVNEQSRQPVENPALRALREGAIVGLANHTILIARDGTERPIDDSAAPIRDEQGQVAGCVLIFRDVSAQRHAVRALEQSEALKSAMFDSALDGIISINHRGTIVEFNAAAEQIFGWRRDDVLGRELAELLIPPAYRERHRTGLARYLVTGEGPVLNQRLELSALRSDGVEFPIELTVTRIPVAGPPVFTAFVRDITDRQRAATEMARLAEELQLIADAVPALISYVDAEGRYRFNNQAYVDWFGHQREEIHGKHMRDVVGEEAYRRIGPNVEAALAGRRVHLEGEIPYKDGGTRFVRAEYVPNIMANGAVAGFYALVTDLSDRKQAEATLRAAHEQLSTTLESITDGFHRFDREWRFIYVNAEAERIASRSRSEMLGKTMWEVFPAVVGTKLETEYRRAIAEQVTVQFESFYEPWQRWFAIKGDPTPDGGLAVFFHDITAQKRHEEVLRENEERFRTLADNISHFAWSADAQGGIYWYNQRWYDYTGTTFDEMQGWGWRKVHHPDHVDRVVARLQHSWDTGEPWEDIFPLRGKDGNYRWFLSRALPIRDADGNVLCWFGTNTDVTEQRAAEEALKESDRRKNEFLAMLAHELRNPLAPIRNILEVMKRSDLNGQQLEDARHTMERQIAQMVRLVDDLLDLSRITRDKLELRPEQIELASVVEQAVETSRPAIESARHELSVSLPPQPVFLHADPVRLAQVFSNLLNNAGKYSEPRGRISLNAERQGNEVVVSVTDAGVGIPPDMLPQIFEMFTQVDPSLERSQGGLGIGLTLVKRLVEMHGGSVRAFSAGAGQGSQFVVRLPVLKGECLVSSGEQESDSSLTTDDSPHTPSLRILVVDDNRDSAKSLALLLKLTGHETHTAFDGLAAVQAAESFQPEVVLLDIGLPKLNGYEACRRIREQPWGQDLVLIALTGWGQDDDRRKSKAAGFNAHLVKPVDLDALTKLLSDLPSNKFEL